MDFITLKEYAQNKGVTYEAIRRQVAKYESELRGHIVIRDRTKYLDEYAQDFLSKRRRLSPVVVKVEDSTEATENLEKTVEALRAQLMGAQNELLSAQKRIIELQDERSSMIETQTRYTALLEENTNIKQQLEDSEQLRREAEAQKTESEHKLEESLRESSALKEESARQAERAEQAERERDEARREADSFTRSWFGFYRKK